MKTELKILTLAVLSIMAFSCCNKQAAPEEKEQKKEDPSGEVRLRVDGKPFIMLGSQLRMDFFRDLDKKKLNELDQYFRLAASLNITVVQLAFSWSDVEKDYDVYSDETVRAYIDYCEKYGLKAELLWFGSYMCGYSVEGHLPPYIVADNKTYPELKESAAYKGWQGKQFYLKPGNRELVDREVKAVEKLMEFIYEYDNKIGNPHTVIGIQVENEPDMLATRHNGQHGFSPTDLWPSLLYHLDAVGKAVKNSRYDCYTRVNQTTTYDDVMYWSEMVAKRDGIDYVGVDPYDGTVNGVAGLLTSLKGIKGNFAHIAENGGELWNNDLLALKALTMGCGYEVFEVVTTPHPYIAEFTLRGVYNPDFTPKGQTQRLIDAFGIYKAAWYDFATAPVESMHGFNLKTDQGQDKTDETVDLAAGRISWHTGARGVSFAIETDEYVTVASTKADRMEFGFSVSRAEAGSYDKDGKWKVKGDRTSRIESGGFNMEPCTVYRIYK